MVCEKIYKWIYALIFAVSLYSCIRWVTDYTKEGHYWTQSLRNSILDRDPCICLLFVFYLFQTADREEPKSERTE